MRESKKRERATSALLKFLEKAGVSQETLEDVKESVSEDKLAVSMQAEAVLLSLEKPARFTTKQCKRPECGQMFGTNYRYVSYCSDTCRAKHLQSQTGIRFDPHKPPEERWGSEQFPAEPPLVIPPEALKAMVRVHKNLGVLLQLQSQTESPLFVEPGQAETFEELLPPETNDIPQANPLLVPAAKDEDPFDF